MMDKERFDFWYAVNHTEVIRSPTQRLETFGNTVLNYHLVSELMDAVNQVRVREGRIEAMRPQIVVPEQFADHLLEGFGTEATEYANWLRAHARDLYILQYGFTIRKQERNEYVLSDSLQTVADRVLQALKDKNDPLSALAIGVDKPWEVSLLKLMVDVVEQSAPGNVEEMRSQNLFEAARKDPTGIRRSIEVAFRAAAKQPSLIDDLAKLLHKHNLFSDYEDRFFALVRAHRGSD